MNKARVQKGGDSLQIAWRCRCEHDIFFFIQRALCSRNHARQESVSRGSTTETVFFTRCDAASARAASGVIEISIYILSELYKYHKNAGLTSGMRGIKLLHGNAPVHKS